MPRKGSGSGAASGRPSHHGACDVDRGGARGARPCRHVASTSRAMPTIRRFRPEDWSSVWFVLRAAIAAGDTLAQPPETTEAEMMRTWIDAPLAVYVALDDAGVVLGTYLIKPNQPGLGGHVCNAGYVVAPAARGQGIASIMCEHSQREAVLLGFRAMQFNLVVSTNEGAVRLWQKHGFRVVGTLPGAFQHRALGFVDAHVMFKALEAE